MVAGPGIDNTGGVQGVTEGGAGVERNPGRSAFGGRENAGSVDAVGTSRHPGSGDGGMAEGDCSSEGD